MLDSNVDKLLVDSAKSMGASRNFIFTKVILPALSVKNFKDYRVVVKYKFF